MNEKIQELQILENNLQNFLSQRQNFQMELNEVENALQELKDYKDEIYKLVSGMLIKTEKEKVLAELKEKKKILQTKIEAVEKQEKLIEKRSEELKKEISNNSAVKTKK